jgi:ATP-binding cassette subfamily B protein
MLAMQVVTIVAVVAEVLVLRSLLDGLLEASRAGDGVTTLLPQLLAITALTATIGVANAVQVHRQRLLAEQCARMAEGEVLAVAASVELAAFDEPDFHDALERATAAVRRLPTVVNSLAGLLRSLAGALGAILALGAIEPAFVPVALLAAAPLWLTARYRGRIFYRFARALTPQDRERRWLAQTLADRAAAPEVRAYGAAGFLRGRHAALWDRRLAELRTVARRQLLLTVLADVVASLVVSATLVGLVAAALSGGIGLADAGAAAAALVLLGQRLAVASASAGSLAESALYIDDFLTLVGTKAPAQPRRRGAAVEARPARIRAEHVTFGYAGARGPVLRDVSLEIAPGQIVALVGENGSGKTTLATILAGLYVPERGRVTWNGRDTDSTDREDLRRGVTVVFQDFLRYALPARENIGMGRHERLPDDEGVRRAATIAGVHESLERLPDGYDTVLNPAFDGGSDLSVGQWQRVALARAVFRDAPFVILDEPTAALDARAEEELFERIRELLAGRSVLLISHRFSSVRSADCIHVLHAGAIVESGTHDELVARRGRYAELFELQARAYR